MARTVSRTRTVVVAAAAVAVAAAATVTVFLVAGDQDVDPNQNAVTELCRDAAADEPAMADGVDEFTVTELTHETEDGATFYRATGTTSTSDGYGGQRDYTFDCRTKLTGTDRWELLDLTML